MDINHIYLLFTFFRVWRQAYMNYDKQWVCWANKMRMILDAEFVVTKVVRLRSSVKEVLQNTQKNSVF